MPNGERAWAYEKYTGEWVNKGLPKSLVPLRYLGSAAVTTEPKGQSLSVVSVPLLPKPQPLPPASVARLNFQSRV
jgi:hypothetical protein